ncbi:MAG: ThuA domain-containing protein, partial [Treponema sp.]|nr:ThuA domain-containing protein [Treponema sp.]
MRILLLCDDYYHPGKTVIDGIEPLKEQGFHFDVIIDARDFSLEMLDRYPVVFLCKMDEGSQTDRSPWKTHEVQEAFVNYVQNGNALVVVHSGIVPAKEEVMLENLIGCRFLGHPNQCPVTVQPVKPHPVTDGVGIF